MEINAKVLERKIDEAPDGILCEKGKRWVKELFRDGFGLEFKNSGHIKECDVKSGIVLVYGDSDEVTLVLENNSDKYEGKSTWALARIDGGPVYIYSMARYRNLKELTDYICGDAKYRIVAYSPEEYFRKKFNGEKL